MTSTTTFSTRKRQSMAPGKIEVQRTTVGQRMSMGIGGMGATTVRRSNVVRQSAGTIMPSGEASRMSKDAVETVKGMRGKEKKDLCDLNGRLAELLEKTRTLEITNKALYAQIEQLKKMKGITGDRIREEYEEELKECRDALDEALKRLSPLEADKVGLEDKVESCEAEIEELRKSREDLLNKIEKLNQMCADLEGENDALKRNIEHAQTERDMYKKDVISLREDNARLRGDLTAARNKQIDAERQRDALAEELQFLDETTTIEIEELRECLRRMQELTPKMELMYQTGMKDTVAELNAMYQQQLEDMKNELQARYDDKLNSLHLSQRRDDTDSSITKSENKHLKTENKDIKDRLRDLELELHSMQAAPRRDDTDGVVRQQNKMLQSQFKDSKRTLEALELENQRLRDQINQLKLDRERECEECENEKAELREKIEELEVDLAEIRQLMEELRSSKMDLELEIACYRKLLDGGESAMRRQLEDGGNVRSQGGEALANLISTGGGRAGGSGSGSGGQSSQQSSNPAKAPVAPSDTGKQPAKTKKPEPVVSMSQSTGRIHISRTSKCALAVSEVDQGGRWIVLDNTSKTKSFDVSNWVLKRKAPRGVATYKFGNFSLPAGARVKVLSYNNEDERKDAEREGFVVLVASKEECKTWGSGDGMVTVDNELDQRKADSTIKYE